MSLVGRLSCDVRAVKNPIYGKKRTCNKIVINAGLKKEQLTVIFNNTISGKESLLFYMWSVVSAVLKYIKKLLGVIFSFL